MKRIATFVALCLTLGLMLVPLATVPVGAQGTAPAKVIVPTDRTVLPIPEPQYPHSTVFDARNGAPEKGLERLPEAATLLETTQERWPEAELHRLRGTLLLSVHKQTAAEESYHQALSVAQRQSAKFWELRASLDLARLWCDQDKR